MSIVAELLCAGGVLVPVVAVALTLLRAHRRRAVDAAPRPLGDADHDPMEDTVRIARPSDGVKPRPQPTPDQVGDLRPRTTPTSVGAPDETPDPAPGRHPTATEAAPTDALTMPLPTAVETRPAEPTAGFEMAWLKGEQGIDGEFLLSRSVNVVGRSRDCDIVLPLPTVSRRHCEIRWHGRGWEVRAMGRNGTTVNDAVLPPDGVQPLNDGDLVRIGSSIALRLVLPRRAVQVPDLRLRAAGRSNVGHRRRNEDAFLATATAVAVADGVGGRPAGAVASGICIDVLAHAGGQAELADVVQRMNAEIRRRGAADPLTSGMASTLDAARLVTLGGIPWLQGAHVGDGFTVLQDGGQPKWLTRAHTYAAALVAAGQLSTSEGVAHPDSSRLVRAVGLDESVRPDVWQHRARPGQRLVVFTDGLFGALGWNGVAEALHKVRRRSPERACEELIRLALRADGNRDNVTVVVADVNVTADGDMEPGLPDDERLPEAEA
ncbi:FHA domain-containing protein [Dactylosporangium sp. NPDC051484]|uniref:FHA domain-containing protein n=1 Tax=Dactylosporangium sp. NPDC051484 TaxID=3154942 RepID=UPI00344B8AC8